MDLTKLQELSPAPRWLDPILPKSRVLDPTGLRVPVAAIGNHLLDGITTITPKPRYLSLRAWLLWIYIDARKTDDWASFRNFVVEVECCIALGDRLAENDTIGVVGSEKAAELIAENGDLINLQALVQQIAFLIYGNPSLDLGLTFDSQHTIPGLTNERGELLALAVNQSVGQTVIGERLAKGEPIGSANIDDLKVFGERTALDQIPDIERNILVDCILPKDPRQNEINRLATYTLLLHLSAKHESLPTEQQFFSSATMPDLDHPSCLQTVRDGWLTYLIRDVMAVGHEGCLAAVVSALELMQSDPSATLDKNEVIQTVLGQALAETDLFDRCGLPINSAGIASQPFHVVDQVFSQLDSPSAANPNGLTRWHAGPSEWDIGNLMLGSITASPLLLPLVWSLARARVDFNSNSAQDTLASLSYQGWGRIGMEQVVIPKLDEYLKQDYTYSEVMRDLIRRTVDQHLRVAWARLQGQVSPKDVAVLTSDGSRWSARRTFSPGRAASRVGQAISWLNQLDLVSEKGITAYGEQILTRSLSRLEELQ